MQTPPKSCSLLTHLVSPYSITNCEIYKISPWTNPVCGRIRDLKSNLYKCIYLSGFNAACLVPALCLSGENKEISDSDIISPRNHLSEKHT